MELTVLVTGADELAHRCKAAAAEDLHDVHSDVADRLEQSAQARASSRQMARAERSNRYRVNANGTEIEVGGSSGDEAWAIGAQWGSSAFHQFPPRAGAGGYTIGPALDDTLDPAADMYADAYLHHF